MNLYAPSPAIYSRSASCAPSMHDFVASAPCVQAADFGRIPAAIAQQIQAQGGFYQANHLAAQQNLHAGENHIRAYLGTYLPRTVFEVQTITAELFAQYPLPQRLPRHRPLRVLDLGSGTGGSWMGLVYGLSQHAAAAGLRDIHIHTIDGNARALAKQAAFASTIAADTGIRIHLHPITQVFANHAGGYAQELQAVLENLGHNFDFILASKHFNELYVADYQGAQGAIRAAKDILAQQLAPQGCLLILEVACRPVDMPAAEFFPSTIARELGCNADHSKTRNGLRILASAEQTDWNDYSKREFAYHAQRSVSKACYFALVRPEFAAKILPQPAANPFIRRLEELFPATRKAAP